MFPWRPIQSKDWTELIPSSLLASDAWLSFCSSHYFYVQPYLGSVLYHGPAAQGAQWETYQIIGSLPSKDTLYPASESWEWCSAMPISIQHTIIYKPQGASAICKAHTPKFALKWNVLQIRCPQRPGASFNWWEHCMQYSLPEVSSMQSISNIVADSVCHKAKSRPPQDFWVELEAAAILSRSYWM